MSLKKLSKNPDECDCKAQHMQIKLSRAGMRVREHPNIVTWGFGDRQPPPVCFLCIIGPTSGQGDIHIQEIIKTKNNYYVDFNTPTMQMLGVVFRFLRTKRSLYFQCIIQVELSRTANNNNLDTHDLWVSSTASVLKVKEEREKKKRLRQWSMQKHSKDKWKREKRQKWERV